MMSPSSKHTRVRDGLIGLGLLVLVGWLLLWVRPLQGLVHLSYDLPFWIRSNTPLADERVVILYMDPEAHRELKQPWMHPWDRSVHAQLVDRLRLLGVQVIAFDVLFKEMDVPEEANTRLVEAVKRQGRVTVAAKMEPQVHDGQLLGWELVPPFDALRAVAQMGVVEEAGANRTVRLHYRNVDLAKPSLAWRAAELAGVAGLPPSMDERWMNYYGPPGTIPGFSVHLAWQLDGPFAQSLSNKVVFVGVKSTEGFTGGLGTDDFVTPHTWTSGRKSPGVEVNATAYLNLARGDWLRRLSPYAETGLIGLSALALVWIAVAFRPLAASAWFGGFALVVFGLSLLMVWSPFHIWVPWAIVVLAQAPLALGWCSLIHSRRWFQEKRELEMRLALAGQGVELPSPEGALSPLGLRRGATVLSPGSKSPEGEALRVADHELLKRIGKGAYGAVYLARDVIGTYHAVKIVHRQSQYDPTPLEREFNGIRNFTPISRSHPGFVHILHVGRNDAEGYIYCVMELGDDEMAGQAIDPESYSAKSLGKEIKKRGLLPWEEWLPWCIRLCEALEHLHRHNLIHRDIKPANIIFVRGQPKFADIGLVTEIAAEGRDVTAVGTPHRMAPEGPGTPSADVFGMGKLIYEVGFGLGVDRFPELPTFFVTSPDRHLLGELNRIVLKACHPDPRARHSSAAELKADLSELLVKVGVSS